MSCRNGWLLKNAHLGSLAGHIRILVFIHLKISISCLYNCFYWLFGTVNLIILGWNAPLNNWNDYAQCELYRNVLRINSYNFVLIPKGPSTRRCEADFSIFVGSRRRTVWWSFAYCRMVFDVRQLVSVDVWKVNENYYVLKNTLSVSYPFFTAKEFEWTITLSDSICL